MSVTAVETFYGLLALLAFATVIVIAVMRAAALASDAAADAYDRLAGAIAPNAFAAAWLVAFLATAGSLYFSEVAGFEPCHLCWYQRIAMYPLVIILAIAAARREPSGAFYGAALAGIGALISTYHIALEWFPSLDSGACDPSNPCTLVWFRVFGFLSLPTLALAAFLLILTLTLIRAGRTP
jgi:disulfide bond formation protein DsbB